MTQPNPVSPSALPTAAGTDVHVVVVTYNGEAWIRGCLESLAQSSTPVRSIVVDNASTDRTADIVEQEFPGTRLIRSTKNLGFGGGNNLGIVQALADGARYVFLLNQDAYVLPTSVSELRDFMECHPEFGVASPLHCSPDADHLDPRTFRGYLQAHAEGYLADACFGRVQPYYVTFGVNAAAWFIRASTLRIAGGFDPLFFMYGEDDDLLHRWRHHGVGFALLTQSRVVHLRQSPAAGRVGFWGDVVRRSRRLRSTLLTQVKRPHFSTAHMVAVVLAEGLVAPLAQGLVRRSARDYLASVWAFVQVMAQWATVVKHARLTAQRGQHFL
ncbi:MAG: glycosyltransferase [Roseateles sp.]|jgi:GT2 family glycosyltransferase|nr:glycosyltransferase [Burkholderiaceae bacterium]